MRTKLLKHKNKLRARRKIRIRGKISGTQSVPRVTLYKSNRTLYVQAIDDTKGHTLAASDGKQLGIKSNKEGAVQLAQNFFKELSNNNIKEVVFDRNGYQYHGVVQAFAEELRNNSIKL